MSQRYDSTSWDEFSQTLRHRIPALPDLSPDMPINDLVAHDRIIKGLLWAELRRILDQPPEELLESIVTLGDAHEWCLTRGSTTEKVASHAALTTALEDMRTAHIRLRPIAESDLPILYASSLDPQWSYRWRYRGTTPSFGDFSAGLFSGVLSQYLVERLVDRRVIGLVSCYNARIDQGWAYLGFTRVAPSPSGQSSEMLEGGFLFTSYAFRMWPFRKLYAEVSGWNWPQFESGAGAFFMVEGVLSDHEYFDVGSGITGSWP